MESFAYEMMETSSEMENQIFMAELAAGPSIRHFSTDTDNDDDQLQLDSEATADLDGSFLTSRAVDGDVNRKFADRSHNDSFAELMGSNTDRNRHFSDEKISNHGDEEVSNHGNKEVINHGDEEFSNHGYMPNDDYRKSSLQAAEGSNANIFYDVDRRIDYPADTDGNQAVPSVAMASSHGDDNLRDDVTDRYEAGNHDNNLSHKDDEKDVDDEEDDEEDEEDEDEDEEDDDYSTEFVTTTASDGTK